MILTRRTAAELKQKMEEIALSYASGMDSAGLGAQLGAVYDDLANASGNETATDDYRAAACAFNNLLAAAAGRDRRILETMRYVQLV